jgi:hypothetical protein
MRWLVVLLVAGCFREAPPPPANLARGEPQASPDVLAYLPGDAEIVVALDVQQIRAAPLWQKYEAALTQGAFAKLQTVCGIDPASIQRVTLAARGGANDVVAVVRGLPRDRFMKCVVDPKLIGRPVAVIGDVVTVTDGGQTTAMKFVDARTLVAHIKSGATADTLAAIVRSGSPLRRVPAVADMFVRADTGAPVWFVAGGTPWLSRGLGMGHAVAAANGSIHITDGVDLVVRMRVDSQGAAQQVAQALKSQLGFTHPFVNSIDVVAEDLEVKLAVTVTEAELDRLVGIMGLASSLGGP